MEGAIMRALHRYNNKKIKESIPVDKWEADEEFVKQYIEYQSKVKIELENGSVIESITSKGSTRGKGFMYTI